MAAAVLYPFSVPHGIFLASSGYQLIWIAQYSKCLRRRLLQMSERSLHVSTDMFSPAKCRFKKKYVLY